MSKGNKSAREMLERIYGKHCMIHQGIRKIRPPAPKNVKYKGKSIASQLTYHHLVPKHLGGKATVENGAELCRSCHDWLEQLSKAEREKVNNELREYKDKLYRECKVTLVDELPLNFKVNAMIFTPKEQKRHYDRAKEKKEIKEILEEEK